MHGCYEKDQRYFLKFREEKCPKNRSESQELVARLVSNKKKESSRQSFDQLGSESQRRSFLGLINASFDLQECFMNFTHLYYIRCFFF